MFCDPFFPRQISRIHRTSMDEHTGVHDKLLKTRLKSLGYIKKVIIFIFLRVFLPTTLYLT